MNDNDLVRAGELRTLCVLVCTGNSIEEAAEWMGIPQAYAKALMFSSDIDIRNVVA